MAKASDNLFPYVQVVPATAPAAPAAGSQRLYLDSADSNKLKRKDSAGTVTTIEGGGTPGRTLITETVLGSASGSITFSAIAATYKHLEVRLTGRSTKAAADENILVAVNGDTTAANYASQYGASQNTTTSAASNAANVVGYISANSAPASTPGQIVIHVPNYLNTTWYKQLFSDAWAPNDPFYSRHAINWKNTAAITSLTLTTPLGTFAVGTIAQLYGLS